MCSISRKILDYKTNSGSETAAILLASHVLEIDPLNNRKIADKILGDLSNKTKDHSLKKQLKQLITQQPTIKLKSALKIESQSTMESSLTTPKTMTHHEADNLPNSEESETPPPKKLTIIFAN
jgi:hypothetical protein